MVSMGTDGAVGNCDSDGDSLFGGGEADFFDSASLFGDGDDDGNGSNSPFMEATLPPSPPASCSSSTFTGLALPAPPKPPALLLPPRSTLVLPSPSPVTLSQPELNLENVPQTPPFSQEPASSLVSAETQRPELQHTFPTPPCEGAQAQGQLDVSTHSFTLTDDFQISWDSELIWPDWADFTQEDLAIDFSLPEPDFVRDAQACPDILQNWDFNLELDSFQDQDLGAPQYTLPSDIPPVEPPGDVDIRSENCMPRRIDGPDDDPERLVEFIPAFTAKTTKEQVVQSLGLRRLHHTALMRELRDFLSDPVNAQHRQELESLQQEVMKKAFIRLSLKFLQRNLNSQESRALQWFGLASVPHRAPKSPIWPDDSSEIVCCVTVLLYQTFKNSKQKARAAITRQQKKNLRKDQVTEELPAEVDQPPAKRQQIHGPAATGVVASLDPEIPVNNLAQEPQIVICLD
ncbi:hypothetical protein MCOR25_009789 [Pyricularia grisea]|uniref:Uncharacterized protein n=1 Tax=Pyricularia grisea TaxID=148305 RepID=A0A6P8BGH4_PYRGI|nr:uncharacterized protein PgNI_01293 [Pyricularia grisea]KAI6351694.1 hypothetical protein MCOR25_009789 [Pyricularia grisea]TLD15878.1 hypothetical protein PgNI_01293 [Pyricularia grisea]